MKPERELARAKFTGLEIEDHGWLVLTGGFEYDGGGFQGFGFFASSSFLMRLMGAVGVRSLDGLNGASCWVTHTNDAIQKVEPLHKKGGLPFVITEWQKWVKTKGTKLDRIEAASSPPELAGHRPV